MINNKWQCSKCKQTKKITVKADKLKAKVNGVVKVKYKMKKGEVKKIKCCDRVMRNLTDIAYNKECEINKSGLRG